MNDKEPNRESDMKQKGKWIHRWVEMIAHSIQQPDTKEWLHIMILDPFVKYIMSRIFPYIILTIILFSVLLILVVLIFITVFFKRPISLV